MKRHSFLMAAIAVTILSVGSPAHAVKDRMAVLDLNNRAEIHQREVDYIGDLVRSAVRRSLDTDDFIVMTRDNIFELLPEGQALVDCVGDCAVEAGRLVGANYVISGEILLFGNEYRVSLQLYETDSGNLLESSMAGGESLLTLEDPINVAAGTICAVIGGKAVASSSVVHGSEGGSKPATENRKPRKPWNHKGMFELGLGGSLYLPRGSFGTYWTEDDPGGQVGIGYYIRDNLAINASYGAGHFDMEEQYEDPNTWDPEVNGPWSNTKLNLTAFELSAKFLLKSGTGSGSGSASPYLKAGFVWYNSTVTIDRYWSEVPSEVGKKYESDYFSGTGWLLGGGVQFRLWHVGLVLEALYLTKPSVTVEPTEVLAWLSSFNEDHDPMAVEPEFSRVTLGLAFWFGG